MDNPLVTIIVPAFNAEAYLEATLKSLQNQTYPNLQIIVVDDGSTDATPEIVRSHASKVSYIRQENSGSCAAPRNTGLKIAKGEFISFFDADDLMAPDKISQQVRDLSEFPSAVMSITNYRNFTDTAKSPDHFSSCPLLSELICEAGHKRLLLTAQESRSLLIEENYAIAGSPLFRATAIEQTNGFDETLFACEDFHLIYRLAKLGSVVINPFLGFNRRVHALNMSNDNERMLRNLIKSREDLIRTEPEPTLRNRLKKRVQRYRRDLQTCLVNKSRLYDAAKLYPQTFPPESLSDLNHDLRQGIKILLQCTLTGYSTEKHH